MLVDPKKQAELDQLKAQLVDFIVPTWRSIYLRCIEEGFTVQESMLLVRTYIMSNCPYGTRSDKE